MPSGVPFLHPADHLLHDHFHLKGLCGDFERALRSGAADETALLEALEDELRSHFLIEEQLLFPTLVTADPRSAKEPVESARNSRDVLLRLCRAAIEARREDRELLMKELCGEIERHTDYERL